VPVRGLCDIRDLLWPFVRKSAHFSIAPESEAARQRLYPREVVSDGQCIHGSFRRSVLYFGLLSLSLP
jgi:hypothetical protein